MKYYLIAGEASGDLHGANLMQSLKLIDSQAEFRFWGGDLMAAQGGALVKHYREMAFMGFIPVLLHLPTILKNIRLCKRDIQEYAPDVVIFIDYPGFNLKIAKYVKESLSMRTTYYISPKVWAWKASRIPLMKRHIDQMLCILPFEVDFFQKHQFSVNYVGNPSVDAIAQYHRTANNDSFDCFTDENKLSKMPIIALLAGSRVQEIKDNLPTMLEASKEFMNNYQIVIAGAPGINPQLYKQYIEAFPLVKIVSSQTYRLLNFATVALVTSGTATLETALLKVPQAVCYKTPIPCVTHFVFKHFFGVPFISLVNLIANKEVVKELFATQFSVAHIRNELKNILTNIEYRRNMEREYEKLIAHLGDEGASLNAAKLIFEQIQH